MPRLVPQTHDRNVWYHQTESDLCIVFVHGLFSNSRDCWLATASSNRSEKYWPELVVTDQQLGDPSVFLAGYATLVTTSDYGIRECAEEVLAGLSGPGGPLGASVLDYPALLFVCHSAGGIVARYILEANHELFKSKQVFLLLLGSPSIGSWYANVLSFPARFLRNQLAQELAAVSPILRDLDGRFKKLLAEKRVPELKGREAYEHLSLLRVPTIPNMLGRIVARDSAGRYFGEPVLLRDADHSSIAKPTSRRDQAHSLLRESALAVCPQIQTAAPPFSRLRGHLEFIDVLKDRYAFRWESGTLSPDASPGVFWPVRLRHPTAIHAVQSFTAAALQRLGCVVSLWIDDLGNPAYPVPEFEKHIARWFSRCEGDAKALRVVRFSDGLKSMDTAVLEKVRKWLGTTEYRLGQILPVCKLTTDEQGRPSLQALLGRRPRRLLTPAMVWAALETFATTSGNTQVITLSGHDERPLWQAWRECAGSETIAAGHLYAPELLVRGTAGDDRPLYMREMPLVWNSKADIEATIERECASMVRQELFEAGRLIPWCTTNCVLLPRFIREEVAAFLIGHTEIVSASDLDVLSVDRIRDGLAAALEHILL